MVTRNDFSLNRNLLQFVGYIFDSWPQFNLIHQDIEFVRDYRRGQDIYPGSSTRLLLCTAVTGTTWNAVTDRNISLFRSTRAERGGPVLSPGFTQGTWIDGQPWKGLNYELFVANGLNTLTVNLNNVDRHLI